MRVIEDYEPYFGPLRRNDWVEINSRVRRIRREGNSDVPNVELLSEQVRLYYDEVGELIHDFKDSYNHNMWRLTYQGRGGRRMNRRERLLAAAMHDVVIDEWGRPEYDQHQLDLIGEHLNALPVEDLAPVRSLPSERVFPYFGPPL